MKTLFSPIQRRKDLQRKTFLVYWSKNCSYSLIIQAYACVKSNLWVELKMALLLVYQRILQNFPFFSKMLESTIYDIRIYIYVAYSRPNCWTDWAEIFWSGGWGCYGPNKIQLCFFKKKFLHGQRRALQLVINKSFKSEDFQGEGDFFKKIYSPILLLSRQ